MVVDMYDGGI